MSVRLPSIHHSPRWARRDSIPPLLVEGEKEETSLLSDLARIRGDVGDPSVSDASAGRSDRAASSGPLRRQSRISLLAREENVKRAELLRMREFVDRQRQKRMKNRLDASVLVKSMEQKLLGTESEFQKTFETVESDLRKLDTFQHRQPKRRRGDFMPDSPGADYGDDYDDDDDDEEFPDVHGGRGSSFSGRHPRTSEFDFSFERRLLRQNHERMRRQQREIDEDNLILSPDANHGARERQKTNPFERIVQGRLHSQVPLKELIRYSVEKSLETLGSNRTRLERLRLQIEQVERQRRRKRYLETIAGSRLQQQLQKQKQKQLLLQKQKQLQEQQQQTTATPPPPQEERRRRVVVVVPNSPKTPKPKRRGSNFVRDNIASASKWKTDRVDRLKKFQDRAAAFRRWTNHKRQKLILSESRKIRSDVVCYEKRVDGVQKRKTGLPSTLVEIELNHKWRFIVSLCSRLSVMCRHVEKRRSVVRDKKKMRELTLIVRERMMPIVWDRRRDRWLAAWSKFKKCFHFYKLWLHVKKKKTATELIKTFLHDIAFDSQFVKRVQRFRDSIQKAQGYVRKYRLVLMARVMINVLRYTILESKLILGRPMKRKVHVFKEDSPAFSSSLSRGPSCVNVASLVDLSGLASAASVPNSPMTPTSPRSPRARLASEPAGGVAAAAAAVAATLAASAASGSVAGGSGGETSLRKRVRFAPDSSSSSASASASGGSPSSSLPLPLPSSPDVIVTPAAGSPTIRLSLSVGRFFETYSKPGASGPLCKIRPSFEDRFLLIRSHLLKKHEAYINAVPVYRRQLADYERRLKQQSFVTRAAALLDREERREEGGGKGGRSRRGGGGGKESLLYAEDGSVIPKPTKPCFRVFMSDSEMETLVRRGFRAVRDAEAKRFAYLRRLTGFRQNLEEEKEMYTRESQRMFRVLRDYFGDMYNQHRRLFAAATKRVAEIAQERASAHASLTKW